MTHELMELVREYKALSPQDRAKLRQMLASIGDRAPFTPVSNALYYLVSSIPSQGA